MADRLINHDYVVQCRLRGYRWNEIAEGLHVTTRVVDRWRERTHFIDPIMTISDTEEGNNYLDFLILSYLRDTGRRGEVFTRFYIQTLGFYVPRNRLRDAIWRVDPYGRFQRRPGPRIQRVNYNVDGPMHLVHIDGTLFPYFQHTNSNACSYSPIPLTY